MNDDIRTALGEPRVIDMTTIGRRTRAPRRIEIVTHVIDGRLYISGVPRPRKRAWLANLEANPRLTIHLKGDVRADVPAIARVIVDEEERRAILRHVARAWNRTDLETMVRDSPLIEVEVDTAEAAA
ncbi:MAG TPA: nitroreductase family deazaflavin-dependent oxidoreductase [Candidatus Limnocylindrales bacterium]|nr:nitroreductase family deazaflavin-dependent oxidoreductase [Candidatus Limnocylindrales bacterium]